MPKTIKVLVYPAKDIEKAKKFFGKFLGAEPYVDSPYYVGYRIGDLEIGLDPNSNIGPIAYMDVDDISFLRFSSFQIHCNPGSRFVKSVFTGDFLTDIMPSYGNEVQSF